MSKVHRTGYVVICDGLAMRLHASDPQLSLPPGGVLCSGSFATCFRTRAQARRAIERTVRYARAHHLPWPILDRKTVIKRLQEEP